MYWTIFVRCNNTVSGSAAWSKEPKMLQNESVFDVDSAKSRQIFDPGADGPCRAAGRIIDALSYVYIDPNRGKKNPSNNPT